MLIADYHKTRSRLDFNFIKSVFDADKKSALLEAHIKNPNAIIRFDDGSGGLVPNYSHGVITIKGI